MLSLKAAWDERKIEILQKNWGLQKNCRCLKSLDEKAKWLLYGFSFALHRCVPAASFPVSLSLGSSSFQKRQNLGDKHLTW